MRPLFWSLNMADYRLYGTEQPATEEIGYITEGIGFPLRPVDNYVPGGGGTGDVTGPNSSTNNEIPRYNGTTGKELQNSSASIDDLGIISSSGIITNGPAQYGDVGDMGNADEAYAHKNYVDSRQVSVVSALSSSSLVTQEPTVVDSPIQISFGDAKTGIGLSLAADGTVTCTETGEYNVYIRLTFGRSGTGNACVLFALPFYNGIPIGNPIPARIDSADVTVSATFTATLHLDAGDELTMELVRDSSGDNVGGIYSYLSQTWGTSASAVLRFSKAQVSQTFTF